MCPKCSTPWTGRSYVGERAVTMTEAYQRGNRRSNGRRSTLADEVILQEGGEDEEETAEEDGVKVAVPGGALCPGRLRISLSAATAAVNSAA